MKKKISRYLVILAALAGVVMMAQQCSSSAVQGQIGYDSDIMVGGRAMRIIVPVAPAPADSHMLSQPEAADSPDSGPLVSN